jgi:hypothetical protein
MNVSVPLANGISSFRLRRRCASFKGRGIKPDLLVAWFARFSAKDHRVARRFLAAIRFFNASVIHNTLVRESNRVMERLEQAGVAPREILVVQVDAVGSSAARAVTTFRRNARAGKECNYCMAEDVVGMLDLTATQKIRAVVYVDDYIGTGAQLEEARTCVTSAIGVSVPEYVISVIILEEAKLALDRECTIRHGYIHLRSERPLLPECKAFTQAARQTLTGVSAGFDAGLVLGFGGCASMVVLADDVPDNAPALLREGLFALA